MPGGSRAAIKVHLRFFAFGTMATFPTWLNYRAGCCLCGRVGGLFVRCSPEPGLQDGSRQEPTSSHGSPRVFAWPQRSIPTEQPWCGVDAPLVSHPRPAPLGGPGLPRRRGGRQQSIPPPPPVPPALPPSLLLEPHRRRWGGPAQPSSPTGVQSKTRPRGPRVPQRRSRPVGVRARSRVADAFPRSSPEHPRLHLGVVALLR